MQVEVEALGSVGFRSPLQTHTRPGRCNPSTHREIAEGDAGDSIVHGENAVVVGGQEGVVGQRHLQQADQAAAVARMVADGGPSRPDIGAPEEALGSGGRPEDTCPAQPKEKAEPQPASQIRFQPLGAVGLVGRSRGREKQR